jgi:hypothetical protein
MGSRALRYHVEVVHGTEATMQSPTEQASRVREVRRIFEEYGFDGIELLESWEGDDLDELAEFLSEEEFQTLVDELEKQDEDEAQ